MGFFDVHAHLTHPDLRQDINGVLARAREAGLTRVVSNGLNYADNKAVAELAAEHSMVRPAYGLYPVDAVLPQMLAAGISYPREADPESPEDVVSWIREEGQDAIAIGEIGLDGHWVPKEFWDRQEAVLKLFLDLSEDLEVPVILHSRKRERRTFELLQERGIRRANFHCFSSRVKLGLQITAAGYYLSIPANARRAENFAALLRKAPRERLLLETDCPYLSPDRDTLPVNEPASVRRTAEFAAELWSEPLPFVMEQFADNYRALFGEDAA